MNKLILLFSIALFVFLSSYSQAQVLYPDSELLEYYRILEMKNPGIENRLNIFPSVISTYNKDSLSWNPWSDKVQIQTPKNQSIEILPLRLGNYYNSTYARGYNDGALWKGKGYTGSLQGGVQGKLGILEFTIAPLVYYSQNSSFELAEQTGNNNPYNYQFRNKRIDYVQRYGDSGFTKFNLGQTDVRMVLKWFTLGVSTQNMTWGPSQRNPILMSNNASGFPHIDIGTYKPVETKIGWFETKIYYGSFKKSEYFDDAGEWNYRYWSGFSFGYRPSFLPSLSIGFNRSFYKKAQDFEASDLFVFLGKFDDLDGNQNGNDEYDQLASFTLRWLFEEVGFETYIEYGINDYGSKLIDTEPEHGRGYILGFSKYIDLKEENVLKLTYEHASVDRPKNFTYRINNSWFTHGIVLQGYTHDGQIIGSGIGPGSTSDYFDLQYFFEAGRLQLTAQRIRFDDDYFFLNINDLYRHDHEWTLESKYSRFVGDLLIGAEFAISFRENQYFISDNNKTNIYLGLNITKNFYK